MTQLDSTVSAAQDLELRKLKAEKNARVTMSKKIAKEAKAKAGPKKTAAPSKRKGRSLRASTEAEVEIPDMPELPANPAEKVEALEAALAHERELENLVASCLDDIKLPSKLPITRLQEVDKSRSARTKGMELALKQAQMQVSVSGASHASATSATSSGASAAIPRSDDQPDFGLQAAIKYCEDVSEGRKKKQPKKVGQTVDVMKLGKHLLK